MPWLGQREREQLSWLDGVALSLGLLLVVALLRWPALSLPLDRDEGAYATIAWAGQAHALTPYVDLLDHKPPLLYGLYAQAIRWGGPSALSIRLFSLLWQALSAMALGLLLLRWTRSRKMAWSGGLIFALLGSAWETQAVTANAEGWVWLPLLAGLALLRPWDDERAAWRWALWGVAAGLAANIKQPYYLWALGLPLLWPVRGRLRALGATVAGLALLQALIAGAYARHGALAAWWQAVFAFNAEYSAPLTWGALKGLAGLLRHLARSQSLLWILAGAAWMGAATRLRRLGLATLALGFLAAALSGRWYPHYAQSWSLGLALLGASAFQAGASEAWPWKRALLLGLAVLAFLRVQAPYWEEADGARRSLRLMGVADFAAAPGLAQWIQSHSEPHERVLIWGAEPEIYFLAQRLPATRQLNHYALTGVTPRWPGAEEDFLGAATDARTHVVVLTQGLDPADPFQAALGKTLQQRYRFRRDLFPPYWVALRRP